MLVKPATTRECELLFRRRLERRGHRFEDYKQKWQPLKATWSQVQVHGATGTGVTSLSPSGLSGTGAGNLLVITAGATNGTGGTINSVTGGGTWVVDSNTHISNGTTFGLIVVAYCLAAPGGVTSFTVNFSASNTWAIEFQEYSFSGSSIQFDTSNSITNGSSATSQPGVSLTLAGNDLVVRVLQAAVGSISNIGSPYAILTTQSGGGSSVSHANALNLTGTTAPTWTLGSSGAMIEGAIAFKENPQTTLPIFNDLAPGSGGVAVRRPTTVVW